jgi:hypothetical protein
MKKDARNGMSAVRGVKPDLTSVATLLLVLGTAAAALAADPPPTPASAPQHVTVPSLPGEANKSGTVRPSGSLQTDADGNLVTSKQDVAPAPAPAKPAAPAQPAAGAKGKPAAAVPPSPAGPAPSGPAVTTGVNTASIRGTVKSYEAGKSLTMTVRGTGKDVTYTLKSGATVPPGLKAGDPVRIRVLTAEKGKVADRVELFQKP